MERNGAKPHSPNARDRPGFGYFLGWALVAMKAPTIAAVMPPSATPRSSRLIGGSGTGSAAAPSPTVALPLVSRNFFTMNRIGWPDFVVGSFPPEPENCSMLPSRSLMLLERIRVS